MQALVFDLGGTHLRCGVAEGGEVRQAYKVSAVNFLSGLSAEEIAQRLVRAMCDYEASVAGRLASHAPVVLSFPGPVSDRNRTQAAPTLFGPCADPPDLAGELRRSLHREVHVLNDLSAAAWRLAESEESDRFLVVTVSSGIGSKIFDRANRFGVLDHVPYAGEIGHTVVDWEADAPCCDCGGTGHLGAISSGRGIERLARRRARMDERAFRESLCVRRFGAAPGTLNNEWHLVPAARANDPWALGVVRDGTRSLARVLATVLVAVGLERVIVTGGFAVALGAVYDRILTELLHESAGGGQMTGRPRLLVRVTDSGHEICLEGAAAYARYLSRIRAAS